MRAYSYYTHHAERKRAIKVGGLLLCAILVICLTWDSSSAKLLIDVDNPNLGKMPIMVAQFTSNQPGSLNGSELASIIRTDLTLSGLFDVIEAPQPLPLTQNGDPELNSLSSSGAQALVMGSFQVNGSELTVECRLYDISLQKLDLGKRFTGPLSEHRYIIHRLTDSLLEKITNLRGSFTTDIAFIVDDPRTREIFLMNYDGYNLRPLTDTKVLNLSPDWAPDGKGLIFTSYIKGRPDLWYVPLSDGRRVVLISDRKGLNASGRFSPDGSKIALSLSVKSIPKIFIINTRGDIINQLTNGLGNDISPTWSPDGANIAYVSDQAGTPQIYIVPVTGGRPKRITLSNAYNTDPDWSPRGDELVFTSKIDGRFQICVIKPDGSDFRVLTNKGSNQDPAWSPDGRMIAFTSNRDGFKRIFVMDAKGTVQVPVSNKSGKSPAWSPRLSK